MALTKDDWFKMGKEALLSTAAPKEGTWQRKAWEAGHAMREPATGRVARTGPDIQNFPGTLAAKMEMRMATFGSTAMPRKSNMNETVQVYHAPWPRVLSIFGPLYAPRVKARSTRGWTAPA